MNSSKIRSNVTAAVALAAALALAAGCSSTKNERAENTESQPEMAANDANNGRAAQTFDQTAAGAPGGAYQAESGTASSSQPITQLSQLNTSANGAVMPGQKVNISSAKVDKVVNDKLFTVKADDGTTIYVRSSQPTGNLTEGKLVNLDGTIRKVPSDTSTLGWDQESAQALQGQQFYIHVASVTTWS